MSENRDTGVVSSLIQPFYPSLDGLRALAFLAVFLDHYGPPVTGGEIFRWGFAGVDVFFVLSGFLITGILYDSVSRPDYFRSFYIRRSLRIFPVFYGVWLLLLLLTPVLHEQWNPYVVSMAAYVGNFFIPGGYAGHHATPDVLRYFRHGPNNLFTYIPLGPYWSLCVEEQFYLIWPLVVWLLRSRKALMRLCLAVIVLAPIGRTLYAFFWPETLRYGSLVFPTYWRIDTLLVGAFVALWLRGSQMSEAKIRISAVATTVVSLAVLALLLLREGHRTLDPAMDSVVCTVGFTLIAFAAAGILLILLSPTSTLSHLLQTSLLTRIGRISYGLYVFHALPFAYLVTKLPEFRHYHVAWLMPLVALAFTFAAAATSFRYFESPFLHLKDRWAPSQRFSDPPPAQG